MKEFYDDYPIDDIDDKDFKAYSTTDMTGLIQRGLEDDAEAEAYEDMYPYMADGEDLEYYE